MEAIYNAIAECARLAARVNTETNDDVFFNMSGHVKWVEYFIFIGGWDETKKLESVQVYFDLQFRTEDEILAQFENLKNILTVLLELAQ